MSGSEADDELLSEDTSQTFQTDSGTSASHTASSRELYPTSHDEALESLQRMVRASARDGHLGAAGAPGYVDEQSGNSSICGQMSGDADPRLLQQWQQHPALGGPASDPAGGARFGGSQSSATLAALLALTQLTGSDSRQSSVSQSSVESFERVHGLPAGRPLDGSEDVEGNPAILVQRLLGRPYELTPHQQTSALLAAGSNISAMVPIAAARARAERLTVALGNVRAIAARAMEQADAEDVAALAAMGLADPLSAPALPSQRSPPHATHPLDQHQEPQARPHAPGGSQPMSRRSVQSPGRGGLGASHVAARGAAGPFLPSLQAARAEDQGPSGAADSAAAADVAADADAAALAAAVAAVAAPVAPAGAAAGAASGLPGRTERPGPGGTGGRVRASARGEAS